MEKPIRIEAYSLLKKMIFSKNLTAGVKRAIRVRLEVILENEVQEYDRWKVVIRHQLNSTRQKQIEREFKKRIQAMKIVVHMLTPFWERTSDTPMFVVRKEKK